MPDYASHGYTLQLLSTLYKLDLYIKTPLFDLDLALSSGFNGEK